jgi:hypothetical protein
MRPTIPFYPFLMILFLSFGFSSGVAQSGSTQLELTEAETGREIFSAVLEDGEQIVLTWKNSLFDLLVTEVFETHGGALVLTQVTYADPRGTTPPDVSPSDAAEFYQTGGPFSAKGLARPFQKLIFRVGEIGEPKMKIRNQVLDFKIEVGFGGGIVLTAKRANSL